MASVEVEEDDEAMGDAVRQWPEGTLPDCGGSV